jgi:hypothetical protein
MAPMNDKAQNQKSNQTKAKKQLRQTNVLESFKDLTGGFSDSLKQEAKALPANFGRQLFGLRPQPRSGEISPGESVRMQEIASGEREQKEKAQTQAHLERQLRQEDKALRVSSERDLRLQLKAIMQEIQAIAKETPELAREVEVASIQAPANPGIYHIRFFEKILEFIKSFRKKISQANTWLHAANTRAAKKNVWGNRYAKHGAKYLLSGEHYLTRSAG